MPRRYDYEDSYERDRRDHHDRRGRGRDHVLEEEEVEYHRRTPGPPEPRVMERERVRERGSSVPDFLREDYGRNATAGQMVLSSRDREPEYRPRERPRKLEKEEREEAVFRRPPERERLPPREFERERRGPPVNREYEREDVAIRRRDFERDDYISRRERPAEREYEKDEVIVRHNHGEKAREFERERDDYRHRPISHERERSRPRTDEREEIIIRRDERDKSRGRRDTDRDRDEIIIRRHEERHRSSSPESVSEPPEPPIVRAPPIHQDVVTHHRHVDHGYKVVPPAHAPRAPSPESPSRDNFEEIDIRRRGERDGRPYDDEIIIDRHEREEPIPRRATPVRRPSPPSRSRGDEDEVIVSRTTSRPQPREQELVIRGRDHGRDRDAQDIREEAEYYNRRATERGHIGEAYNGATRDWEIVDVPPGTKRVTMDGVGGGSQEVSWQRYNGVRRSKFVADGEDYASDRELTRERDKDRGRVGRRYVGVKDRRENLWTEITKDLVIKEAIEKMGYDYEETDYFYYIIAYLRYDDIEALVALSEDLRERRRDRMHEIERERAMLPRVAALPAPPAPAPHAPPPLMLEGGRGPPPSRPWDEERVYERDIIERRTRAPPLGRGARW